MKFLKGNKRFSFKLDGVDIWDTEYTSKVEENENEVTTVYYFKEGIKVTNIAKKYDEYDAYEWVNFIENTSDSPTGIISELWDCDCTLPMEYEDVRRWTATLSEPETATRIFAPSGSTCVYEEFAVDPDRIEVNTRVNHFFAGETRSFMPEGGRSNDGQAPFFNVNKGNAGYIFAIGWTGQWKCEITRNHESLTLKSKVEDTRFRMLPKECFRTSSVVIMSYESDVTAAQNKWRRLVKKYFSLVGREGRDAYGPLCAGIWGGMKSELVLENIKKISEYDLPVEYIWMDAGWYGAKTMPTPDEFEGDWPEHVGDWRISPNTHPGGLKDVTKAIRESGKKFLLWFEPERAIRTTPVVVEHPEYFLSDNDEENNNRLLNLGNPDALEYCVNTISGIIEDLNIDFYRQDFNFKPLEYWRKNDAEDRCGITEIKHINGLYKFWDTLLESFPWLMIDNCAGGGRRIDIEMLRRSIPLWRSDFQCAANFEPEASQYHHLTFNAWMPYSGTSAGRFVDEYRIRSAYDGAMTSNFFFSVSNSDILKNTEKMKGIRKYTKEYLSLRPYFSEDMYPLTEPSTKKDVWCAVQFNRPGEGDGIVQVFRREKSPCETAVFSLRGLERNRRYRITDIDGGEFEIDGNQLLDEGLRVTVSEKRKAKIYMYKAL